MRRPRRFAIVANACGWHGARASFSSKFAVAPEGRPARLLRPCVVEGIQQCLHWCAASHHEAALFHERRDGDALRPRLTEEASDRRRPRRLEPMLPPWQTPRTPCGLQVLAVCGETASSRCCAPDACAQTAFGADPIGIVSVLLHPAVRGLSACLHDSRAGQKAFGARAR